MLKVSLRGATLAAVAAVVVGCGLIADKNQIVVARVDGKAITRGDLKEALRVMPDDKRPIIVNRGDLERYLREHVDYQIREGLRLDLAAEGKINVAIEQAEQRYFTEHPDQAMIKTLTDPTPLGITERELQAMKADVDYEIGLIHDAMMREQALEYFTAEAVKEGLITLAEDELRREYELNKENLQSFEYIDFVGLRFPVQLQDAVTHASNIRRRLDAGESFDAIIEEFAVNNPQLILASRFENNPNSQSFQTFWLTATGVEEGQVIGPVFIPAYSLMNSEGERIQMPDAYLVLRVEAHEPTKPLPYEDARGFLAHSVATRKAVQLLREQHGVEFYDQDLWDPGMATTQDLQL